MSKVYFIRFNRDKDNRTELFDKLIKYTGMSFLKTGDRVAIKAHFGEKGCQTYVNPEYSKKIIAYLKEHDTDAFLTDTSTLYHGKRSNGIDHKKLAEEHGFGMNNLGIPVIIADGDDSTYVYEEILNLKHFKSIKLGKALNDADSLVIQSHFKAHLLTGFGGAIKNLGMGFGSPASKQKMHADVKPKLKNKSSCTGCGTCAEICPYSAIKITKGKADFDLALCAGCGECITICPEGAIRIQWDGKPDSCMEKIAETAFAALKRKTGKVIFFNFLTDITPDCDCVSWSHTPIVHDIGVLASFDPVAIDAASLYLVNQAQGRRDSSLKKGFETGADKFKALRPDIDGRIILEYAESIGLGSKQYELIEI